MKLFLPLSLVFLMAFAAPFGAYAKKGKKGEPEATPAPMPMPNASNPAEALSPYIVNLEQLLALKRPPALASQPLYSQTSGLLLTLRQQFVGEQEKAAADKKNAFAAAIGTCDLITAALDDRSKTLGNLGASQAVAGSGKMEEQARKDNIAQGIKGHGLGKAVSVIEERDREKQATAKAETRAAGNDDAISAMASNQWNQRSAAWRQKIAGAYSQIK